MNRGPVAVVLALAGLLAVAAVQAEQRALLIGVGKYRMSDLDLPGIDLDLDRVEDMLRVMGFEESQILRLADAEATSANVLEAFDSWLTDGVDVDDRVVVYYSGHGSFIPDASGDEPDGVDEVLVTHDVRFQTVDGRRSLAGIVTDDQIAAMIERTPSNNVLVLVDACHSGTMTRNILLSNRRLTGEPVFEKAFAWDGMPLGDDTGMTRDLAASTARNTKSLDSKFVGVAAAGDGEKAIGTSRGGMFTIGFTEAIVESARAGSVVTITEARNAAENFIRERIDASRVHTPVVTGSTELANGSLEIVPIEGNGPVWNRLVEATGQGRFFPMTSDKTELLIDDVIKLSLEIPEPGYLNLVTVDSKDNATVLFPNEFHADNYVEAGRFDFPEEALPFDIAAAAPAGPTLLVAFLSEQPLNLREMGYAGRGDDGDFADDSVFTTVSYTATRALKIVRRQDDSDGGTASSAAAATAEAVMASPGEAAAAGAPVPAFYASSLELRVREP